MVKKNDSQVEKAANMADTSSSCSNHDVHSLFLTSQWVEM